MRQKNNVNQIKQLNRHCRNNVTLKKPNIEAEINVKLPNVIVGGN